MLPFSDHSRPDSWASRLRQRRFGQFLRLIPDDGEPIRILDVGGTEESWVNVWEPRLDRACITILNLEEKHVSGRFPMTAQIGDARDLSRFQDREFDFCFSNSLIEHLGTLADQKRAASEIRRVAKGYFVQTPYRYFPLEPHFQVPFWAQLPVPWRVFLHRHWRLGWMQPRADYERARREVEQIRLLTVTEMKSLFPDADIRKERIWPFTKSLIAVRG